MNHKEKATYLVYHRGRDPKKFRLGNLVVLPQNPEDSDPYIFPYSPSDLHKWTGDPQLERNLRIEIRDSHQAQISANVSSTAQGGVGQLKGSNLTIEGENACRFQIDQATEFLNSEILSRPEAREWLNSRITVSRGIYYMNQLKSTKARYPEIWMVTGIQLLSNVTVRSGAQSQSNLNVGLQLPPPSEFASGITAILANDGFVGAKIERSNEKESCVEYQHVEERIWAAQFRRLKLNFKKEGQANPSATKKVSVQDLLDIGKLGMKGSVEPEIHEATVVSGVHEDDLAELVESMRGGEVLEINKLQSTARRRALLIGGSESNLHGVRNDLQAMSELLVTRGFIVDICFGEESTRNGILNTWARFIRGTAIDDAVVVYYSGHGGSSERDASGTPHRIQYILPADVSETTESDFRGILDVELSHLITALTDKTQNVTVILDCCHPERMARESSGIRADNVLSRQEIDNHMKRLQNAGFLEYSPYRQGNPYSVRVVAAESDKPAYEGNHGNKRMGHLTALLVEAIEEAGDTQTSWDAVLAEIRQKMRLWDPHQRPQVEGPKMRALFSLQRVDYWGQLSLDVQDSGVKLLGGLLAEVRAGDEYAIMPPRSITIDVKKQIARATVLSANPGASDIKLEYENRHNAVPSGSKAFPVRRYRPGYGVKVSETGKKLKLLLKSRLRSAKFIHQHTADKDGTTPFAWIERANNKLILFLSNKSPTFTYPLYNESEYAEVVNSAIHQIDSLGRAEQLLNLRPETRHALDMSSVSVEGGTIRFDEPVPFTDGEEISIREKELVYLKILNEGRDKLFASVFIITAIGSITWLSQGHPSGAELHEEGKQAYVPLQDDFRDGDPLYGFPFVWPSAISKDGPINEAFFVIVTNQKVDLGFLGTAYRAEKPRRELPEDFFNRPNRRFEDLKFGVKRIDYRLEP